MKELNHIFLIGNIELASAFNLVILSGWKSPLWISHRFLLEQLFLALPKASCSMWITSSIEGPNILWDVHLINSDSHLCRPFKLIFKPGVWNSKVQIASYFNWRISPEEDFPMIVYCLENGCEVDVKLR